MAQQTLVVSGLKEMLVAARVAGPATSHAVRAALRESGDIVREGAAERLSKYSAKSAAGFKVRVRQRGVAVEQSLRKTTGPRSRRNYPGIQMHILSTELELKEPQVEARFERALDEVEAIFNA